MASHCSFTFLLFCCLFFPIISSSIAKTSSFRPKALLLPIIKDSSTTQYLTQIKQRTPLVPVKLTLDLGAEFFWVDCEQGYVSSTYKPARCRSAQCNLANSKFCGECISGPKPGCNNNTCSVFPVNSVTRSSTGGELAQDVVAIQSTDGSNPGRVVSVPNLLFTCAPSFLLEGLASGVKGEGDKSSEYFIGVKSIKINDKAVRFNTSLLFLDSNGIGGTRISTIDPYTVLHSSIYIAVANAFVKALGKMVPRVAAVTPFGVCFNSSNLVSTRVGPAVPDIDLVLHNDKVFWRIFGTNSMVQVKEDVLCLRFVDGGVEPRTSIVIGARQLENNLLQFDLAYNRLGFSSSLLFSQTTCSNFNFTSNA